MPQRRRAASCDLLTVLAGIEPLVIERETAPSEPCSVAHASSATTSAATRDVEMLSLSSASRGTAEAVWQGLQTACVHAPQPRMTRHSCQIKRRIRSATGPRTAFSGKENLSSCETSAAPVASAIQARAGARFGRGLGAS
jgi:hypothetical protein